LPVSSDVIMSVDPREDQKWQTFLEQNMTFNMLAADALTVTLDNKIKYTNVVEARIQEYEKRFGVTEKLQAAKKWLDQKEFDYEKHDSGVTVATDAPSLDEEKSFDASEDSFDPDDVPERSFDPDLAADKDSGSDSDSEEWDPCDVLKLEDITRLLPDF